MCWETGPSPERCSGGADCRSALPIPIGLWATAEERYLPCPSLVAQPREALVAEEPTLASADCNRRVLMRAHFWTVPLTRSSDIPIGRQGGAISTGDLPTSTWT